MQSYTQRKLKKDKSVSMKSIQRNEKSIGFDIKDDIKDDITNISENTT